MSPPHHPQRPATSPARSPWPGLISLLGEALLSLGVLVLLFVVWQVWWVTRQATDASAAVVDELGRQFATTAPAPPTDSPPLTGTATTTQDIAIGIPFGLVTVPRFGNGPQPLLQGTATAQLDRGIGHDKRSAMPGQIGNFATAGHRDTYSHPYQRIDHLERDDAVVVEVKDGWAIYRVDRHHIVEPTQVDVYAPVPGQPHTAPTQAWMTLVACEPHWTAQKRWVVHAKLQHWVPRTPDIRSADKAPLVKAALTPPGTLPKGN